MVKGTASQATPSSIGAALTRRLSKRDLRELVRLTMALKLAGADAFVRHGVEVHLVHKPLGLPRRQGAGAAPPAGGVGAGRTEKPALGVPARTPRRQRRYDRGQQRAVQRNQRKSSTSQVGSGRSAEQQSSADCLAGTSRAQADDVSDVAATAHADAAMTASPAHELLHPQQLQQHQGSRESMVLGLAQPPQAVREKRSAPSTPPRVHGEHVHAEDRGSPESVVPVPKRAHASSSSPDPPPSCVGMRIPSPTKEFDKIPYQQPKKPGVNLLRKHHSNESDSEDDEPRYLSALISESDRPIYAALKAASLGDQSAQFFLMEKYSKGELSPPMREMMEAMTEVKKK